MNEELVNPALFLSVNNLLEFNAQKCAKKLKKTLANNKKIIYKSFS